MTAQQFNKLNLGLRELMWNEHGVFVDERTIYNKHRILIYSMFNFYVEVYYKLEEDEINDLIALETAEDWEGYLSSIHLDLFN